MKASRPRIPRHLTAFLVAAASVLLAAAARAQSCAMCRSALGDDALGRAFSWSVLFLMAAPYTIVGTAAAFLFYKHWRASGRRRATVIDLAGSARRHRQLAADEVGGEPS